MAITYSFSVDGRNFPDVTAEYIADVLAEWKKVKEFDQLVFEAKPKPGPVEDIDRQVGSLLLGVTLTREQALNIISMASCRAAR